MPASGTRSGVFDPVWVTLRVAEREPDAVGRNVTATVTDSPGPRVRGAPSSKPSENIGASAPEIAVDSTTIEPDMAPLRRTTSWLAVCPTGVDGRLTDMGSATSGAAPGSWSTPVPDSGMLSASDPEWLTRSVADRGPAAVGENTTVTVSDAPGSSAGADESSNPSANMAASGPAIPIDSMVSAPELATLVTTTSCVEFAPTAVGANASDEGVACGCPLGVVQATRPATRP